MTDNKKNEQKSLSASQPETDQDQLDAGATLKAAREAQKLSLKDVSEKTRLPVEVLDKLETMSIDPADGSWIRMHAINYANLLGLDSQAIAAGFSVERGQPDVSKMPAYQMRMKEATQRKRLIPAVIAAGCVVLVCGAAVYIYSSSTPNDDHQSVSGTVTLPALPGEYTTAKQSSARLHEELSVRATRSAWIEVRGSDGTIFRNRNMSEGEIYYPRLNAGWTITVRDAGAFEWWLGDFRIGSAGEDGERVYSASVDRTLSSGLTERQKAMAEAGQSDGAPQ